MEDWFSNYLTAYVSQNRSKQQDSLCPHTPSVALWCCPERAIMMDKVNYVQGKLQGNTYLVNFPCKQTVAIKGYTYFVQYTERKKKIRRDNCSSIVGAEIPINSSEAG